MAANRLSCNCIFVYDFDRRVEYIYVFEPRCFFCSFPFIPSLCFIRMHFVLFCEFAPRASTCREDPIEWHLVFPSSPSRVPFGRDASLSVGTEGLSRAMLFLGGRNFVLVGLLMGSSSEASVSWGSDVDQLVVDSKLLVPINIVTGSVRLDPAARYLSWGKNHGFSL